MKSLVRVLGRLCVLSVFISLVCMQSQSLSASYMHKNKDPFDIFVTDITDPGPSCLSTMTITSSGVYFLCADTNAIIIQASNVTLNLSGYRVTDGVTLTGGVSYVTVKNGNIGPITGTVDTDGIVTGICQNCIFQDLLIEHCNIGIHMIGSDTTIQSYNTIISCTCSQNQTYGIYLDTTSYNTIQECVCSYNLTSLYCNNSDTVQNITAAGAGILLSNAHRNSIENCVCTNNVSGCFSNNQGSAGTVAVTNCTLTGAGIYLSASVQNSITGCTCDNNFASNMCSNTGGLGTDVVGGGAGIGGSGGNSSGFSGSCTLMGAGIILDITSSSNNIVDCSCNNNSTANLSGNTGGLSLYDSGPGAAVGGGGAGISQGGTGTCVLYGAGIYIAGINNSISASSCIGNVTSNLCSNQGSATEGSGSAGVGGGGGGGYDSLTAGGAGLISLYGGGIYITRAGTVNNIQNCQCSSNNTGNLCGNSGGTAFKNGGGGAGTGGSGAGVSSNCFGGTGTVFITGGGIYIAGTSNSIVTCVLSGNNVGNFNSGVGGGSRNGGGGAGVGGGGGSNDGSCAGGSCSCSVNGGGINVAGANNYLENCQCNSNNTDNFDTNTVESGSTGNGAGVGGGGSGYSYADIGGQGTCVINGGGIFLQDETTIVNNCESDGNNINNLLGNSSIGDGYGLYPGTGICHVDQDSR